MLDISYELVKLQLLRSIAEYAFNLCSSLSFKPARTDDCHAANELTIQSYLTLLFKSIHSFQWEVFVWLLYNALGGYLINL